MTTGPNVVLIILDTVRAQTVYSGLRKGWFPHLQRLRDEGMIVKCAFATAPWTLPSHASLFTGQYPSMHGAHAGHKRLDDGPVTLASVFRDSGYETIGISNNTWISEEFGFGRGFQTFRKNWQYIQSDTDLGKVARTAEGVDKLYGTAKRLLDGNPVVNFVNTLYGQFLRKRADDDGAESTNAWIQSWLSNRGNVDPFFLFVNYLEPHLEYRPPRSHAEKFLPPGVSYDEAMAVPQDAWEFIAGQVEMSEDDFDLLRALYRAEIAYLDERLGELRDYLEAAGVWKDTVIAVTADHGENIGEHGLMDHQYCLYDTLIRVPLFLAGGAFPDSDATDQLVQLTDLGPTLLDAAGIDASEFRQQAHGYSFHPDADTDSRDYVVAEYLAPQPSMAALEDRVGEIDNVRQYERSLRGIRTSDWKLIRGSDGTVELYEVSEDPWESVDRSETDSAVVRNLRVELDEWLDSFERATTDDDVSMSDAMRDRLQDLGYLQ